MPRYFLDTTVLIDHLRGHPGVQARITALLSEGHDLAVCAVSIGEVFAGLREQDREPAARFLSRLRYINLSFAISRAAGEYQYAFARRGRPLKITDLLIGAAAEHEQAVLLTDNTKDFPLPRLQVERLPAGR